MNSGTTQAEHRRERLNELWAASPTTVGSGNPSAICPDLLRLEQLGEADRFRGKLVRAFFWLIGPR